MLGDAAFFAWLEQNWRPVFAHDAAALGTLVSTSVKGKAEIVARDETETGDRMLLNLGHTFGHALEAWAGYSRRLLHGEAVAIGICLAFRLSEELGLTDAATVAPRRGAFGGCGPADPHRRHSGRGRPTPRTLIKIMGQDKKVRDGTLTLILVRGIGKAFVSRDVGAETVRGLSFPPAVGAAALKPARRRKRVASPIRQPLKSRQTHDYITRSEQMFGRTVSFALTAR